VLQSMIIIKQISEFLDWDPIEFGWCSLEPNQTLMVHTLNLEPRFEITVMFKKNHGLTFPLLTQPLSCYCTENNYWTPRRSCLARPGRTPWPSPKISMTGSETNYYY